MAKSISRIFHNPEIKKEFAEFNKKILKKFTLERKIKSLIKIYEGENIKEEI
jgi:hypothetical protein